MCLYVHILQRTLSSSQVASDKKRKTLWLLATCFSLGHSCGIHEATVPLDQRYDWACGWTASSSNSSIYWLAFGCIWIHRIILCRFNAPRPAHGCHESEARQSIVGFIQSPCCRWTTQSLMVIGHCVHYITATWQARRCCTEACEFRLSSFGWLPLQKQPQSLKNIEIVQGKSGSNVQPYIRSVEAQNGILA